MGEDQGGRDVRARDDDDLGQARIAQGDRIDENLLEARAIGFPDQAGPKELAHHLAQPKADGDIGEDQERDREQRSGYVRRCP